jgi:hypothetical protein
MIKVKRNDMDKLGYCARGARRWFARMGLDWAAFVRDGIDADALRETGDAMALRLVAQVMSNDQAQGDRI